jgi:hypothetical protein
MLRNHQKSSALIVTLFFPFYRGSSLTILSNFLVKVLPFLFHENVTTAWPIEPFAGCLTFCLSFCYWQESLENETVTNKV